MFRFYTLVLAYFLFTNFLFSQSASFQTFMNPVIPGDHPDCTLSKVGNDFYTTGSSFNPTPIIYHSTDLVHWEAIAQPVSAAWSSYGDQPAGGCWGGQVVYYNNKWWDFFGKSFVMYFVTADKPEGPWSAPVLMDVPSTVPGFGADNSIFIDDNGKWYLLVKNGQENNWIVELGSNGQPKGAIFDLRWINPDPSFPYSWAEGPVMWKHNGYYYYSFARDVSGGQKVFRSDTLTANKNSWVNLDNFFNESDPLKNQSLFQSPNHSSAAVELADGTSWVIHPVWRRGVSTEWGGQGRQGLLNEVKYDANDKPVADYPINAPKTAPKLPSSGIPWMVPHSDFFNSDKLNPEWSFLGYTSATKFSLTTRSGWLTLTPKNRIKANTIIKNDGEHNYSIITKVNFTPAAVNDQAGIWIFNGLQTLYAKLYSSLDSSGNRIAAFNYKTKYYEIKLPALSDYILMLKLVRVNHILTGYVSVDGLYWTQIGNTISVADMDVEQPDWNKWTGNRQGLFVQGTVPADFDYYIYRDAFTPILAECPANQNGTSVSARKNGISSLDKINDNDWALYAGVEFGNDEYIRHADSLIVTASCNSTGGTIEVWLDSLDSENKIAECSITNTGSWDTYQTFITNILKPVSGKHDVYVRFKGSGTDRLFMLQWLKFVDSSIPSGLGMNKIVPEDFFLYQNYPNPFNPSTTIKFRLPVKSDVSLTIVDILGKKVREIINGSYDPGEHSILLNAPDLASGIYFYKLSAGKFVNVKKLVLLK